MGDVHKVVVLGGGLAGLSAAWKLAEAGFAVEVIEKADIPGGLSATINRDGYLYDYGGHRFITKREDVIAEIQGLMGDEFSTRERKTQYLLWNKRLNYPLELGNLVRNVSPVVSAQCLLDYIWTTTKGKFKRLPQDNFEDWVVSRFGRHLYEIFFGQYTAKIWGIPPSTISKDWAAQRISILSLGDAIRQLVFKPKEDPRTYTRKYYYCDRGIGRISERMVEQIVAHGGNVRFSCPVTGVGLEDGRVRSVTVSENGEEKRLDCDLLINTIPITDLVQMMSPEAPADVIDAARKLRHRAMVFLFVVLNQEKVSDNDALYVPEPKYTFFRIEQYKFWSPEMVPDPNTTSLCLEISCFKNDETWHTPDEELLERSVRGLIDARLLRDKSLVTDYFSKRLDHVYPVFEIGYRPRADLLRSYVDSLPNLISYGRQGYYQYIHMHHVIAKGFKTAEHLIKGVDRSEIQRVGTEEEYLG